MKKMWLVIAGYCSFGLCAEPVTQAPFDYDYSQIERYRLEAPKIVRNAQFKRAAIIGGFMAATAFYVYRTWHKYDYWKPPIEGKTTDLPWGHWASHLVKNGGELFGQLCAGALFSRYAGPLVQSECPFRFNSGWFITQRSHLTQLTKSLEKEFELLPLVDQKERICNKVAMLKTKCSMFVDHLMQVIGYLQYIQQQTVATATMRAGALEKTINDIIFITVQWCVRTDELLQQMAQEDIEGQTRLELGSRLVHQFTMFRDDLFADLTTFALYEQAEN